MKTLVTGGAGFIGSHLVDSLLKDPSRDVLVVDDFSTGSIDNLPDSDRLEVVSSDIRSEPVVREAVKRVDEIYHLAAAVGVEKIVDEPLESLETNLRGTELVLGAASTYDVPTFVASSSEVYGKDESVPFDESDDRTLGPTESLRWSYASAKAVDEMFALAYYEKHGLPVVVGRYFNIVGPRQSGQYGMVVPTFVEQALNDEPLTVYGDGTQTRSFTHVRDAVEITRELLETPAAHGDVYNVGSPHPTSINDLAELVIDLADSDSEIEHVPYEVAFDEQFEEPQQREPDVTKLERTLGWHPETDLVRTVRDVIEERRPAEYGQVV
ncbi:NAD-dependent epimerase/dehydratase family protein [Natrarchaeobius oligotrophus]|uniref:UDP-glucuronate decarboxylase n=1 Tax=Natrarchaeobius chitinivorans TaxID=1679083 RepID=A0A3N6M8G0_NATCH|nr:GDP-mannose 4,6-dehydratase [Natrarchaeobius chitinivorans]RQG96954.1 NAD-dependent epimerase/dehydratase family protein [Natrarchaeobius chitinivorans]